VESGTPHERGEAATSSAARAVIAVRGLHRFAIRDRMVDDDVAVTVRPPTPQRRLPKAISVAGFAWPEAETCVWFARRSPAFVVTARVLAAQCRAPLELFRAATSRTPGPAMQAHDDTQLTPRRKVISLLPQPR
jgi:hypothetical protein